MGLKHVFGIPGDYVLGFYNQLVDSPLKIIGTCSEIGAGFAADAYARVNGLGAVCVTYCVGGFNVLNAVAGAYAEKSPLVIISGAPGMAERRRTPHMHHRVGNFNTQQSIFEKVTVASVAIEDAALAPTQIDHALSACLQHKRPVYIELPRDMAQVPCPVPRGPLAHVAYRSNPLALEEALLESRAMLSQAKRPVILAGVEIHRYGLQRELVRLVEKTGYPVAATLLGKSVISEIHPQYAGIYVGAMGKEPVRQLVEQSDCLLMLGVFMTDINLGINTAQLNPHRSINANEGLLTIKHHHYADIRLGDIIRGLTKFPLKAPLRRRWPAPTAPKPFKPLPNRSITVNNFFSRLNHFLVPNNVVICDIGDSLFGAADLTIHRRTDFISPAFYTSMGFAVPAAIGAQIRNRELRPIVFVGDGAFQMTGQEVSTIARYGLNPIIFVLNNKGYTTERFIHEGPYNDIQEWAYHLWPQIVRKGWGCEVRTEGELEEALTQAKNNRSSFSIINVQLDKLDRSDALERLGRGLGEMYRKAGKT
jgi:indolepyruvate decarboxylase